MSHLKTWYIPAPMDTLAVEFIGPKIAYTYTPRPIPEKMMLPPNIVKVMEDEMHRKAVIAWERTRAFALTNGVKLEPLQ